MQNWAAITVTDMRPDGPLRDILITATGCLQNTGMHWTNENSVGADWEQPLRSWKAFPQRYHLHPFPPAQPPLRPKPGRSMSEASARVPSK